MLRVVVVGSSAVSPVARTVTDRARASSHSGAQLGRLLRRAKAVDWRIVEIQRLQMARQEEKREVLYQCMNLRCI